MRSAGPPWAAARNQNRFESLAVEDEHRATVGETADELEEVSVNAEGKTESAKKQPETRSSIYVRLLDASHETRLLILAPASDWSVPVVCDLHTWSFVRIPTYKALSYVWGKEDSEGYQIQLGGERVNVRSRLYNALKRIRQKDQPLRVWVDALCINQKDVSERNQQVKLMASIYSGAEEVLVCFDDDEAVNESFAQSAEAVYQYAETWRAWKSTPHSSTERMKLHESYEVFMLMDFVDEPWWNRVWTAQEFILAKAVKFCFFGDRKLTVQDVEDFIRYLEEPKVLPASSTTGALWVNEATVDDNSHDSDNDDGDGDGDSDDNDVGDEKNDNDGDDDDDDDREDGSGGVGDDDDDDGYNGDIESMSQMMAATEEGLLEHTVHIKRLIGLRKTQLSKLKSQNVLDIVAFSRYRRGKDHRDKIFAFAALSTELNRHIDYNVSLAVLYENFAVSTIKSERNLDLFNHIATPSRQSHQGSSTHKYLKKPGLLSLPSWTPNWSLVFDLKEFHALDLRARQVKFHRACDSTRARVDYVEHGTLLVHGMICSTIDRMGAILSPKESKRTAVLADWIKLAGYYAVKGADGGFSIYGSQAALQQVLTNGLSLKCMTWLNDWNTQPTGIPNLQRQYEKLDDDYCLELVKESFLQDASGKTGDDFLHRDQSDEFLQYRNFIFETALGRRLVVDNNGKLAFVPATSEIGDLICVLYGGKTPYVLRKEDGDSEQFKILGPAYHNNLMSGEAIADVAKGKLKTQKFVLV